MKMNKEIYKNSFKNNLGNLLKCSYVVIILQLFFVECRTYSIPTPTARALSPKGFRVSIPDENGIEFFAFHGNINREFRGTEVGDYSGEVRQKTGNEWVFETDRYPLKHGDILHYWIYVQHEQHGYQLHQMRFVYPNDFGAGPAVPAVPLVTPTQSPGQITTTTTRRLIIPKPATPRPQPACRASITVAKNQRVDCAGKMIFEEQFDRDIMQNWLPDVRMPLDTADAEFVMYSKYPNVWNVSNSNLHIFPKLITDFPEYTEDVVRSGHLDLGKDCTYFQDYSQECVRTAGFQRILPAVVTSAFSTRKSFSFKYGTVEIRAKLPKGDWLFPQLTLDPVDNLYYGPAGFANGQIRIAFIRGNEYLDTKENTQISGNRLTGGIVITTGEQFRDAWLKQATLQENHLGDSFHKYSITWTEEKISFSVDGTPYAIIRGGLKNLGELLQIPHVQQWHKGTDMAPFDREFYVTLGVGVGGIADFPDGCKTGRGRTPKPWENTSPKAELKFFQARNDWRSTWTPNDAGLIVDYVKVWSI